VEESKIRVNGIAILLSPLDNKMDDPSGVSVMGTGGNPHHIARRRTFKCKRDKKFEHGVRIPP